MGICESLVVERKKCRMFKKQLAQVIQKNQILISAILGR